MFAAIATTQWKTVRAMVFLFAVATFTLPLVSVQAAGRALTGRAFLEEIGHFSVYYAGLAAALGLVLGIGAWSSDQRGRHVYALTLPVARWRYVAMRLGASILYLIVPALTLFIGALIASRSVAVPTGLNTYAFALAIRFLFASLVALTVFFAISSATARTAAWVIGTIAAVLLVQFFLGMANTQVDIASPIADLFLAPTGMFGVFGARWMLIDV
jgi:hypothetical protein